MDDVITEDQAQIKYHKRGPASLAFASTFDSADTYSAFIFGAELYAKLLSNQLPLLTITFAATTGIGFTNTIPSLCP